MGYIVGHRIDYNGVGVTFVNCKVLKSVKSGQSCMSHLETGKYVSYPRLKLIFCEYLISKIHVRNVAITFRAFSQFFIPGRVGGDVIPSQPIRVV